ncbi:MAG: GNAT family N-acetyltransferase [Bacteroidota bacterium]
MISIRPATTKDIPVLIDFQQRLALETESVTLDANILQRGMQALFDDPSKGVYFVAEHSGKIVGCHMITYEWSDWRNGMVWWLQSVYVTAEQRKHGVFKKMFDNLVNMINQDPSVVGLRLYVDKTNVRAQSVYTAMGMNGDHYTVFERMKA